MTCVICKKGETQPGTATRTLERGEVVLVVRHVPAEVCDTCGEAYYDAATVDRLLAMLTEARSAGVETAVRQYAAVA